MGGAGKPESEISSDLFPFVNITAQILTLIIIDIVNRGNGRITRILSRIFGFYISYFMGFLFGIIITVYGMVVIPFIYTQYSKHTHYGTRNIYRVSKVLGHSKVTTTQIYADFDNVQLESDFGPEKEASDGETLVFCD